MKNIKLLILLISCITLVACSSDTDDGDGNDPNSEYYMSYEVNNNKITYTAQISAVLSYNSSGGLHIATILGVDSNSALSIYLYDTEPFNTTTYTEEIIPNKFISKAIISYGTQTEGFTSASPIISEVANANVTITEINATYIVGSFNSALVANSDYNTITHTIENGKFKIKFLNP